MSARYTTAYSLIEILISLSIIGILFAFGYANFRDFGRRQTLAGVAKQVQGDIRLSQEMALSGQKPNDPLCNSPMTLIGIRFRVFSSTQYYVNADCSGGIVNIKIVDLPSGVIFASPFPSPNPIEFKVLGQGTNISSGQSAIIYLNLTGISTPTSITLTPGGQIQ